MRWPGMSGITNTPLSGCFWYVRRIRLHELHLQVRDLLLYAHRLGFSSGHTRAKIYFSPIRLHQHLHQSGFFSINLFHVVPQRA